MTIGRLLTFMSVIFLTIGVAPAQHIGSRLPGSSGAMVRSYGYPDDDAIAARPTEEAVSVLRGMTKCVVARKRADVEAYLVAQDEASRQASFARFSGVMSDCMSLISSGARQLQMSKSLLGGALAESLLTGRPTPSMSAMEPSTAGVPYWLSGATDQRIVQEMAICLVDRFPHQSLAFIRSASGSTAEQQAFDTVVPLMGPCLVSGASLHANRAGVRFALAAALYHRLINPSDLTPTEKK